MGGRGITYGAMGLGKRQYGDHVSFIISSVLIASAINTGSRPFRTLFLCFYVTCMLWFFFLFWSGVYKQEFIWCIQPYIRFFPFCFRLYSRVHLL